MAEPTVLHREDLDRMRIETGEGKMLIGCLEHPGVATQVFYDEGEVRLLCMGCGFEVARVKVALKESAEEIDQAIRNQVIGYLKGKAMARDDEQANARSDDARRELDEEASVLREAALILEGESHE